jgi:eukaryotic-like serine/threonine-protein kinase
VLDAQGNLPAALASVRTTLAASDRLAKADPANAGWQRDLAMSHSRVATVLAAWGERGKALEILQAGRAMIARLTEPSPDNAMLSKNLAWFDAKIAEASKRAAK